MTTQGPSDTDGAVVVEKEMALKRADLLRGLEAALGTTAFQLEGDAVVLADGPRRFEIGIGQERLRRIALLEVPAMTVRLRLVGYAPAEAEAALDRFTRAFQRGGG